MNVKIVPFLLVLMLMWIVQGCSKQTPEQKAAQYREFVKKGDEQLNSQHFDRALEFYLKAKPLAAEDPSIHFRIAKAARGLGKSDVGLQAINELVRLAPKAEKDSEVLELRTAFSTQQATNLTAGMDKFASNAASPSPPTNVASKEVRPQSNVGNKERTSFDTLTTRELIIADATGNPRMVLNTDSAGGWIKVLNTRGSVALQLEVADSGGLITVRDDQARPRIEAGISKSGNGVMRMMNATGKNLVTIATDGDGDGWISIADKEGNEGLSLGIGDGGLFTLRNKSGQSVAQMGASSDGVGVMKTSGANGKDLVILTADGNSDGVLSVSDKQGREVFSAKVNEGGSGLVSIRDSSGKALVTISSVDADKGMIQIGDGRGNTLLQIDGQKRRIWSAEYPGSSSGKVWPSQ
jgi:hypothetical protein